MSRYIYTDKNNRLELTTSGPDVLIRPEYRWRQDPNGWRGSVDPAISLPLRLVPDFIQSLFDLHEDAATPKRSNG